MSEGCEGHVKDGVGGDEQKTKSLSLSLKLHLMTRNDPGDLGMMKMVRWSVLVKYREVKMSGR
jgi:hypothetical protein